MNKTKIALVAVFCGLALNAQANQSDSGSDSERIEQLEQRVKQLEELVISLTNDVRPEKYMCQGFRYQLGDREFAQYDRYRGEGTSVVEAEDEARNRCQKNKNGGMGCMIEECYKIN